MTRKQVRVIAINHLEGKAYTRTFKNEPDAWSAYRETERSEIMYGCIGRVEKFDNGTEVFTPWNEHRRGKQMETL